MVIFEPGNNFSEYSRCGRTDKGVSALGNVLAFKLRAPKIDPKKETKDFDYMKMVNGCLPPDIRVLSSAVVHDDFNAR
jgi:tRNA pseudouridine38/39 synthase